MRITVKQALLSMLALSLSVLPSFAQSNMNAQEQANLKFVLDWWREVIQSRHMELAPKYQAENYIQHNINMQTGRDGLVKFFGGLGQPVAIAAELTNKPAIAFGKGDDVVIIWEREGKDRRPDEDLQHLPRVAEGGPGGPPFTTHYSDSRRSKNDRYFCSAIRRSSVEILSPLSH